MKYPEKRPQMALVYRYTGVRSTGGGDHRLAHWPKRLLALFF